jgi:hypothetical protein
MLRQILVPDADYLDAQRRKRGIAVQIATQLGRVVVNGPVELDDKLQRRAIQIDNESTNHVLASKLPAIVLAAREQSPCDCLGRCRVGPQFSGSDQLGAALKSMLESSHPPSLQ